MCDSEDTREDNKETNQSCLLSPHILTNEAWKDGKTAYKNLKALRTVKPSRVHIWE